MTNNAANKSVIFGGDRKFIIGECGVSDYFFKGEGTECRFLTVPREGDLKIDLSLTIISLRIYGLYTQTLMKNDKKQRKT